jgi:hypothetical protein
MSDDDAMLCAQPLLRQTRDRACCHHSKASAVVLQRDIKSCSVLVIWLNAADHSSGFAEPGWHIIPTKSGGNIWHLHLVQMHAIQQCLQQVYCQIIVVRAVSLDDNCRQTCACACTRVGSSSGYADPLSSGSSHDQRSHCNSVHQPLVVVARPCLKYLPCTQRVAYIAYNRSLSVPAIHMQ